MDPFVFSPLEDERLRQFLTILARWNPRINLIARSTMAQVWDRHVLDSAQLFPLAPPGAGHWGDLGSGGGFPGLVVAVLACSRAPQMRVTLVESDGRKAAFLREAARMLGLQVAVHATRIEDLAPLAADVVSARALAPLPLLWPLARRHLASGGIALFPKGASHADEVAALAADPPVRVERIISRTDPSAVILRLHEDPA